MTRILFLWNDVQNQGRTAEDKMVKACCVHGMRNIVSSNHT